MRDFLRRYVAYNFGLKLLSLALAVGLWLGLAKDPVTEIALDIPIEFHGLPDDMVVSSPDVYQAHIWLRGPERLIHRLSPSDVHAEMSVSPGTAHFRSLGEEYSRAHRNRSGSGCPQPVSSGV